MRRTSYFRPLVLSLHLGTRVAGSGGSGFFSICTLDGIEANCFFQMVVQRMTKLSSAQLHRVQGAGDICTPGPRGSKMMRASLLRALGNTPRKFLSTATEHASPILTRAFENIIVSHEDKVAVVELHRPKSLNALNEAMITEVVEAMEAFDNDPSIHAIVLTGNERAFAAGADIKEMADRSYYSARYKRDSGSWMDRIAGIQKPVIAAVNGFALGGGCELAMAADVVIAAEDATFGQPEIQLGTIPGFGGTQRLVHACGKAKAMEMILTGRHMNAAEAESAGLVSRVAPKGKALQEAKDVAEVIAKHSLPVLRAAKECVNVAAEMPLSQGIIFERRAFQSTFALDDQKEGMKAFIDKRPPSFSDR